MPCCTRIVTTYSTASAPMAVNGFSIDAAGSKAGLAFIFQAFGTTNQNPVQLNEKNWQPKSLRFLTLAELKISSGKFTAKAIFQELDQQTEAAQLHWLELFLALWNQES